MKRCAKRAKALLPRDVKKREQNTVRDCAVGAGERALHVVSCGAEDRSSFPPKCSAIVSRRIVGVEDALKGGRSPAKRILDGVRNANMLTGDWGWLQFFAPGARDGDARSTR